MNHFRLTLRLNHTFNILRHRFKTQSPITSKKLDQVVSSWILTSCQPFRPKLNTNHTFKGLLHQLKTQSHQITSQKVDQIVSWFLGIKRPVEPVTSQKLDQIVNYFLGIKRPVEPITGQMLDQTATSWVLNVPSTILAQSSSPDKTRIQRSFAPVQNASHKIPNQKLDHSCRSKKK